MNLINLKKNQKSFLNKLNWLYLKTGVNNGKFNMLCDLFLLEALINQNINLPILRVYAWSEPTISLGVNQKLDMNNLSLPHVQRVSGGQAVFHDVKQNELTYSLCLQYGFKPQKLYFEISKVLIVFLNKYGLKGKLGYSNKNYLTKFNCFKSKTQADIVVNDIKVIGSAQYRKKEYILQHGSIKLDLIRKSSNLEISFDRAALDLKSAFQEMFNINFLEYPLKNQDYEKINNHKLCLQH